MVKEIDCFKREGTRVEAIFKNFSDLTNDLGLLYNSGLLFLLLFLYI